VKHLIGRQIRLKEHEARGKRSVVNGALVEDVQVTHHLLKVLLSIVAPVFRQTTVVSQRLGVGRLLN